MAILARQARQDRQTGDSGGVPFGWQTPWVAHFGQKCHFFPVFARILIVTTVRSPGRADPSFLAIKPLGILPAAGLGFAKTLNYYGFTKRLRRGAKMAFLTNLTKCQSRDIFDLAGGGRATV